MKLIGVTFERRPTFEEAEREAGVGYQNDLLLSNAPQSFSSFASIPHCNQPIHFSHSLNGLAASAFLTNVQRLNVLDVGGAFGHFLHIAQQNFGSSLKFDWTVLETPMYAEYGSRHVLTDGLKFTSSIESIIDVPFDVVHFGGVLQFIKDYKSVLEHKTIREAPFIFISRTAFADEEIVYLQKAQYDTGLVQYAGRVLAKRDLFEQLEATHVLHASWADAHTMHGLGSEPLQVPSMLWRRTDFRSAAALIGQPDDSKTGLWRGIRAAFNGRTKS